MQGQKGGLRLPLLSFFVVLLLVFSAAGCSSTTDIIDDALSGSDTQTQELPVVELDDNTVILGSLLIQPSASPDSGGPITFEYNGGEITIPYQVVGSGNVTNVGLILYLDGDLIPFSISKEDNALSYYHIVQVPEENIPVDIPVTFTPPHGNVGDALILTVGAMYNAEFKPDLVNSSSYGVYHDLRYSSNFLHINEEIPSNFHSSFAENAQPAIVSAQEENKVLTDEILSIDWIYNGPIEPDTLETFIRQNIMINGEEVVDKCKVSASDPFAVDFYLCGIPGVEMKTVFFLDHTPLATTQGNFTFVSVLQKGKVSNIELEIDPSYILDAGSTFYAISIPVNPLDFPGLPVEPLKIESALVYKH